MFWAAGGATENGSCRGWIGDVGDVDRGSLGCVTTSSVSIFLRLMGGVVVVAKGVLLPLTPRVGKGVDIIITGA